jgi:class 3 adenylate cyclase/TolB-like protein
MERDPSGHPWQLVAVWFADIVGYSHISSENPDRALELIDVFHHQARTIVEHHGGRLVKFIGDAALAEFSGTDAAARSAVALVKAFEAASACTLRVGLHVGDVAKGLEGDLLGDGVNLAARLQTEAEPGQVLVSEHAWHQLRHRDGYRFTSLGKRWVKGQSDPIRLYAIASFDAGEKQVGPDRPIQKSDASKMGHVVRALRRPPFGWVVRAGDGRGHRPTKAAAWLAIGIGLALTLWLAGTEWRPWADGAVASGRLMGLSAGSAEPPDFDLARVAVLYFDDHSSGQDLAYLADGLTEALIHELGQVSALRVVSRNGVKPYRGLSPPLDSIVQALRVGSVVEGSVTQSAGRVRVTVQLIDGFSGDSQGSEVLEHPAGDLLALQDNVVQQVARFLRRTVGREIRLRETVRGTENPLALELVFRANSLRDDFAALRRDDADAGRRMLLRADSALQQAERLDPEWSYPMVVRGWIARDLARLGGDLRGRYEADWSQMALAHAERAVVLQPDDPEGFELRGILRHELSRGEAGESRRQMMEAAESDLRRAVELDERRARAWLGLSELLLDQARFAEARLSAERALYADAFLEIPPGVLHQIYYVAVQVGPAEDARRHCDLGRNRYPMASDFIVCQLFMLASFPQVRPDIDRAWVLADSLLLVLSQHERESFRAYGTMLVAQVTARAGFADSARTLIRLAGGPGPTPDWLAYNAAHARVLIGEEETAVDLLSRYLAAFPDTALLADDWWFAPLHSNSRFRSLVGRAD